MAKIGVPASYGAARKAILQGIVAHNREMIGKRRWKKLAVTLTDDDGRIVGGVTGEAWAGWLFIQLLWIDQAHRGQDHGTGLMARLEEEARQFGATSAYVDTFSFQARGFYEKLGYEVFGTLDGYPEEHQRFWLRKVL